MLLGIFRKLFAALCLLAICSVSAAAGDTVTIFAAASTKEALTEIAASFQKASGIEVRVVPGGSNELATQILQEAPADLFLSASAEWAAKVGEKGLAAEARPLLGNQLVIVVPAGNPAGVRTPNDLIRATVKKIALAGETVPAGLYARQALDKLALYKQLLAGGKVVRGVDVRAALAFVARAEVEAGIVYATDAKVTSKVESVYTFPAESHDPIVYPLVLLQDGQQKQAARRFFEYLGSAPATEVFRRAGFSVPDAAASTREAGK